MKLDENLLKEAEKYYPKGTRLRSVNPNMPGIYISTGKAEIHEHPERINMLVDDDEWRSITVYKNGIWAMSLEMDYEIY